MLNFLKLIKGRKERRKKKPLIRKVSTIKAGCSAPLRCKLVGDKVMIWKFYEGHNHKLVSVGNRQQMKINRRIGLDDAQMLFDLNTKSNVGATTAYNIISDLNGGFSLVGPSSVDFQNFRHDMNRYVGESDAHIFIENLLRKQEVLPNFTCEHKCGNNGTLLGVFWSDYVSKFNYQEFGDIVSFDATYKTNKYKMVFVPLTGIDNHKKLVCFGAALLTGESIESFNWFLDCFLKTFGNEPSLVVTDHDPAMKEAIDLKFKHAKHRLCMWHISSKLRDKVGHELYDTPNFRDRMNLIFLNRQQTPEKFETRWKSLIDDYKLHEVRWFNDMYKIKEMWVPCFFMDTPMNALMRTSSLSESENAFFSKCKNRCSTLVDFYSRFEAAMERQRHTNRLLEYEMENKLVKLATTRRIEKHARDIYTPSVFLLVQDEICRSSSSCYQTNSRVEGDKLICVIQEKFPEPRLKWDYHVKFNEKTFECDCSCLLFVREGRLCRHVFVVYYINEVHAIPDRYILKRWSKGASEVFNSIASELNPFVASYRVKKELLNKFRKALFFLKDDTEKLELLRDKFDVFISEFFNSDDDTAPSRFAAIEQLYGFPRPALANVHGPKGVRNKGERSNKGESSNKRYLPAVERNGKKQRACKKCGILGHNRRSCDKRNAGKQKMKLVDEDDEDYDSIDEQLEEVGESQD
ncbi:protein FAR1-RELATED SEQUENCE 5-like [Rutidosis leptorrhynchoides]|uniref:protein FAR1-RELATED SEQUENCE 5-like n=1 Tax=Rutidosis leptorrhynchoides TaxID=125765 RepID=UPI003A991AF8